jgi:hypothetical protein
VTAVGDLRMAMLRNGYTSLPCSPETKRPVLKSWPRVTITAAHISGWELQFPKVTNTGCRLTAIDVDISDEHVCEALRLVVGDWCDGNGEILVRLGNPPRYLIPLRITDDVT